jgi:hypothetical protein
MERAEEIAIALPGKPIVMYVEVLIEGVKEPVSQPRRGVGRSQALAFP